MCALEAEEAFAAAPDRRRIFYHVSGKGPFVLVMPVTWGMDSFVYTKALSSLEYHLALVTFDPLGVGRSDPTRIRASSPWRPPQTMLRPWRTLSDCCGAS